MPRLSSVGGPWRQRRSTAVFISYRREDTSGYAGRLYDRLGAHFGRHNVFIDIDTIGPGVDYFRRIDEALDSCQAMLVLIGPKWVTASLPDGSRRLADQDDLVRHEIASALQRNIMVIPVLVQNTPMPGLDTLPESLRDLARRNAFDLSDHRWGYDLRRLTAVLEDATGSSVARTERKRLRPATVIPVVLVALAATLLVLVWSANWPPSRPTGKTLNRLTFSDSLAAASGRWSTSQGGACLFYFTNGAYRIQVSGQYKFCQQDTRFSPELAALRDVRVEVDAVWTKLPSRNLGKYGAGGIALRCRAVGNAATGSSYSATFSPNGYYELARFNGGKQTQLHEGTTSTLVTPLGTQRRLRLDCLEQNGLTGLKFYADGHLLTSFADQNGLATGAVGIEVDSFHKEPVEAEFRNLRIYEP
jgi:TIR domain